MEVTKLNNSAGQKADLVACVKPVLASGVILTAGTANDPYTQTVVAGKRYLLTSNGVGVMWFSVTGVVSTAANIEWCLPKNGQVIIEVPVGKTTLYFSGNTNASIAYMATVDSGS
jgi:hypothetical protein